MTNTLSLLLLVLCLVAGCQCAASTLKVNFTKTATCPSNAVLPQLHRLNGARDARSCFVDCAANRSCSVVYVSNGPVCHLGTREQLDGNFSATNPVALPDTCVSHVRTWEKWSDDDAATTTPAAASGSVSGLSAGLNSKLVLFIDFRQGYTNLVNPSKYFATKQGSITRDSLGAHFPGGSSANYIEIDTDGNTLASTHLSHGKDFSFYAKLFRQKQNGLTLYHSFYDCSDASSRHGEFGDRDGRIRILHAFPYVVGHTQSAFLSETVDLLLNNANVMSPVSIGASISSSDLVNIYNSGSMPTKNKNPEAYPGDPLCLRLGYDSSAAMAMNGRFVCYVIANAVLSLSEFQELEAKCS